MYYVYYYSSIHIYECNMQQLAKVWIREDIEDKEYLGVKG